MEEVYKAQPMVSNYPQQLTTGNTHEGRRAPAQAYEDDGLLARAMEYVSQTWCGLHGHDSVLHFEDKKILLRCTSCGYDSPGWEVNDRLKKTA